MLPRTDTVNSRHSCRAPWPMIASPRRVGPGRRVTGPAYGSPDLVPAGGQRLLDGADTQLTEVKHARREHGVGSGLDRRCEVFEGARAPAGDQRHGADGPYDG